MRDDSSHIIVSISEPWEFQDENDGRASVEAKVIATAQDSSWIVEFNRDIRFNERAWRFAFLVTRHTGQRYFDDPSETDRAANILPLREPRPGEDWDSLISAMSADKKPPFLIGTVMVR
jgi:hypothetical protein